MKILTKKDFEKPYINPDWKVSPNPRLVDPFDTSDTVSKIKEMSAKLSVLSNSDIEHLYRCWSDSFHGVGWQHDDEKNLREFIRWATTAPCELVK